MVAKPIGGNGQGPGRSLGLEAMLRPLRALEATCRAWDAAERELVQAIGVPICVGCGQCCATTTPLAWDVEAQFIVSWLMGHPGGTTKILSRCEGWLLDRDPGLTVYGLKGAVTREEMQRLVPEMQRLLQASPCPMLEDRRCLIYEARPLVCRAYGVTRMASRLCTRPLSKLESGDVRAHIGPLSPLGVKLRQMLVETLKGAAAVGWINSRFLATSLFAALRPDILNGYVDDNRIASAKLVLAPYNPAILFQDQLNAVWAHEAQVMTPKETGG